jgi:hypothetical protein
MPVHINDFEVVMEPPAAETADAFEDAKEEEGESVRMEAWQIENRLRRLYERRARVWAD